MRLGALNWLRLAGAPSLLAATAFLGACAPTETGNPPNHDRLVLGLTSSAPDVAIAPGSAKIVVEELWQGIARLGYMRCGGIPVYLVDAPFALELVSGFGTQIDGRLPAGQYCTLLLQSTPVAAATGIPDQLTAYSFLVRGELGDGTPFEVVADNVGLERPFAAMLERGAGSPPLLLELDAGTLLPPLGLDALAPDPDGVVRLDRSTTGDPGNFHDLARISYSVHEDVNSNGLVDADEPDLF